MKRKDRNKRQTVAVDNEPVLASGKASPVLQWAGLSQARTLALFGLLFLLLVSGLSVVRITHENRFAFNALQEQREEAVSLNVAWGQLLLEQSTFGVEGRIEQKAVEQLQMQVPEISDIVMVNHE